MSPVQELADSHTSSHAEAPSPDAWRTLVVSGVNHALHDGYTDLIYVLLPLWHYDEQSKTPAAKAITVRVTASAPKT